MLAGNVKVSLKGSPPERARDAVSQIMQTVSCVPDDVAVEWPRITRGWGPADAQVPMAAVAGALAMAVPGARIVVYYPNQWKRSVKREILPSRAAGFLTTDEHVRIENPGNDGWHAIGIGLVHLGRAQPGLSR